MGPDSVEPGQLRLKNYFIEWLEFIAFLSGLSLALSQGEGFKVNKIKPRSAPALSDVIALQPDKYSFFLLFLFS
jgi:hypothetical protein